MLDDDNSVGDEPVNLLSHPRNAGALVPRPNVRVHITITKSSRVSE